MLNSATDLEDQLMWLDEIAANAEILYGAEAAKALADAEEALIAAAAAEEERLATEAAAAEEAAAARKLRE